MIATDQLRDLLAAVPDVHEATTGMAATVIDVRSLPLAVLAVLSRPWAAGGYRQVTLSEDGLPSYLAADLKQKGRPVLLLTAARNPVPAETLDTLFAAGCEVRVVIQGDDDRLRSDGRLLRWDPRSFIDRSRSTHVCIRTQRERWFRSVDLPLEIELAAGGQDESKCVIGLEIRSDYTDAVPSPVWYRLLGGGDGRLRVDIEAGSDLDWWDVRFNDDPTRLRRIDSPRRVQHGQGLPSRLAVIFDRTCPDRSAWVDAYSLAVTGVPRMTGGSADHEANALWDGENSAAAPATPVVPRSPDEFNREIRSALGDALAGALEGQNVRVDGWWFADTAGDGVSSVDGVVLPIENTGAISNANGDLRDLFVVCTYSPGLDLWDPVEEALRNSLDRLEEDPSRRAGILIIGNSPPNVPADPGSPLQTLVRALGYPTSFRRFNALWHAELRRAEAIDVPIVYLFLTHSLSEAEIRGLRKDYLRSADLSQKVLRALEGCIPLVSAEADAKGVAAGVQQALRLLSTPKQSESCIMVRS